MKHFGKVCLLAVAISGVAATVSAKNYEATVAAPTTLKDVQERLAQAEKQFKGQTDIAAFIKSLRTMLETYATTKRYNAMMLKKLPGTLTTLCAKNKDFEKWLQNNGFSALAPFNMGAAIKLIQGLK